MKTLTKAHGAIIIENDDGTQQRWWTIRQNAIEIGLMAERNLIECGELKPEQRRVITRKESRQ